MKPVISFVLLLMVFLSAWLIHGALYRDFGRRHLEITRRFLPSFLIWPKDPEVYARYYKITAFFAFFISVILLIAVLVML